jgi:hypothetical protein
MSLLWRESEKLQRLQNANLQFPFGRVTRSIYATRYSCLDCRSSRDAEGVGPTSVDIRACLGRAIAGAGTSPRHLISDKSPQFWPTIWQQIANNSAPSTATRLQFEWVRHRPKFLLITGFPTSIQCHTDATWNLGIQVRILSLVPQLFTTRKITTGFKENSRKSFCNSSAAIAFVTMALPFQERGQPNGLPPEEHTDSWRIIAEDARRPFPENFPIGLGFVGHIVYT